MTGRTALDPRRTRSTEPAATSTDGTAGRGLPQHARPCRHHPRCPGAESLSRDAAQIRIAHPEQGWSLLCNGVIVFDDTGELLPDGRSIAPRRAGGPNRP
ncbi:MAG: DUF5999 family protein [Catenulispora sp.]